MKLPPELIKYDGQPADGPDDAIVKMGTLKRWIAASIGLIPRAGGGLKIRRSDTGDIWTVENTTATDNMPWHINAAGHINPAYVGDKMPTLGGEPLTTTANVLDLSHEGDYVYFKLNFTTTWVESYLASWTLNSVSVEQGASLPAEDADTKYLAFNYISGGAAIWGSFFNQSISVRLLDAGVDATMLDYNP